MSGIVGKNLGRGSGLVKVGSVGADSVTGASIADDAIDSEHYTDGSIDNAHLADDAVGLAEMAGGTDGNLITYDASGDPAFVASGTSGQFLKSQGANTVPIFADAAGGGITEVDSWRVTTALEMSSGDQDITANWERDDTDFTALGSGMTESSGIFSFPSTGYWLINCQVGNNKSDAYDYVSKYIKATVNNSSYANVSASIQGSDNGAGAYSSSSMSYIFDVTNTTNCKIKLMLEGSEASIYMMASSAWTWTGFNFIRLADT